MKRNEQQSIRDIISVFERSKGLIESIIDNLGLSVLICDQEGYIYRGNREFARLFKLSMEILPGQKLENFFSAEDVQKTLWGFKQLHNGANEKIQLEFKVNDERSSKTLLFELKHLSTGSERVLFTLSGTDITEFQKVQKKQTMLEQQLEYEQKKNLRLVIQVLFTDLLVETNFQRVPEQLLPKVLKQIRFDVANYYEFNKLQGVLKKTVSVVKDGAELNVILGSQGSKSEVKLHKEQHWLVKAFRSKGVHWHTFESGFADDPKVRSLAVLYIGIDNTSYGILEFRSSSLDVRDETYFELFQEIAQKMASLLMQTELKAQVEEKNLLLENATRMIALGEMSGGIAHEINNPLTIIYGKLRNLLSSIKSENYEIGRVSEGIEQVLKTLDRITSIVRGLRVFSNEGRVDELVTLDINTVIENTFSICSDRFQNAGIQLNSFSKEPVYVRGNENQLSQVLLHLLNNSYDALDGKSERWVKVNIIEDSASMYLYFTDSGSGIPAEIARRVLQPFFTTKDPGKGTGLGLSISFSIIKAHGGDLYLNPHHPNTQFVIKLPKQLKIT